MQYQNGQKMVSHIQKCDGTGLKNYWSRKQSDLLRLVAHGLMTLEQVDEEMTILKEKARQRASER